MSERTEMYGFTKEKMLHLLGPGQEFATVEEKRATLRPIDCVGDNKKVAIFYLEFIATVPHNHWYSKVNVPEGADANTKLWAEIELSEDAMALSDKLVAQYGLPVPDPLSPPPPTVPEVKNEKTRAKPRANSKKK